LLRISISLANSSKGIHSSITELNIVLNRDQLVVGLLDLKKLENLVRFEDFSLIFKTLSAIKTRIDLQEL